MSSLRKYLKRKSYKERSQPAGRNALGLLEKHKDYIERAKVHHEHQQELEDLQRAAAERNPNEFYFSMEHERTRFGVPIHVEKALTPEEELVIKSKDLKFVNLRIQQETKEVERLKANLHLLGCKVENRHIVFVESEQEARKFQETKFFQTPKALLDRNHNRLRKHQVKEMNIPTEVSVNDDQQSQYEELNRRLEVLQSLKSLAQELTLRKEVLKGDERTKIVQDDGTVIIKWKKIRK